MGIKIEILKGGNSQEIREFEEGTYKIGRSSDNDIHLKSPQVSKQHGLLIIKGDRAALVDVGSSNGIFINGILVKKHRLEIGDSAVIGEFSFQLVPPQSKSSRFDSSPPPPSYSSSNLAEAISEPEEFEEEISSTPQERFSQLMDDRILQPLYGLTRLFDWRLVLSVILAFALVLSVVASVVPVFRWGKSRAIEEAILRAQTIVSQVVRENYRILAKTGDTTKLTVELAEAEKGIREMLIIDPMSKTVFAPAKYFNKSITDLYSLLAIRRVVEGKEDVVTVERVDDYVMAQPITLFSEEENDRIIQAVVLAEFKPSDEVYSTYEPMAESILIAILLGLIAYYLIFKMVTRPILEMQEQLDGALKGEKITVRCATKFSELESLSTTINFSISRWKQQGMVGSPLNQDNSDVDDLEYIKAIEAFDVGTSDGLLVLDKDKKVGFVGNILSELIGMRNQYAAGQNISDACRDQSFSGTVIDLAEKVMGAFGQSQFANLEVNGINRSVVAIGQKNKAGEIRHILIIVKMNNG